MSVILSNIFGNIHDIDLRVGKPSIPNLVGAELVRTYGHYGNGVFGEGVHDYPLDRGPVVVLNEAGEVINLGKGSKPLDLTMRDAFATLQPQVTRDLPGQDPAFIPAAGLTGAHFTYINAMKWALDTFNRLNRPFTRQEGIEELVGGFVMSETTFSYFVRQLKNTNLEHIAVELRPEDNWAMTPSGLKKALERAHDNYIFPLGLTSISPDAPVHNIRDRKTALGLYEALEGFNEDRMAWLIQQSGGHQRFEQLKASSRDFADAVSILARPKIFDDPVYLSTEAGTKHTCLFAELHNEVPAIVDDIVTGASLSKLGMAGVRAGAVFVFNEALARHVHEALDLSVEGLNYSAFMPLTLLHAAHPKNAAFRQSIIDYADDLYLRSSYFSALNQTGVDGRILMRSLPKLNRLLGSATDPFTKEGLVFGAIPGVTLLHREAAGYFTNLHFDKAVWGPAIGAIADEAKVLLTPIDLKDSARKPMAVFRMNCHTSFENLTGVYARLRHLAMAYGITPASVTRLSSNANLQARRPATADMPQIVAPALADDVA